MSELRFKIASVWRGEWSDNEIYNVLDEVSFSGDIEEIKHGNYRSLLADNKEPLSNESAWALILDLEKTQSATQEAEEMNEAFKIAENERKNKENERKANEELRKSAEITRENEESKRITNERTRVSYETSRNDAETNRRAKEIERNNNEQSRISAETIRDDNEDKRIAAEIERDNNETSRINQENIRKAAENNRSTEFTNAQNERAEAFIEAETERDAKIDAKLEDITRLQEDLDKKANIDGYYSSMAVGAAESLIGQNVTTQQFTYQPTGDTLDVQDGRAVVKSIKGNTVVVNQIFEYDYSQLDSDNEKYHYHHGKHPIPLNHKVLIKFKYSNSNPNLIRIASGLSYYGNFFGGQSVINISVGDNIQTKFIVTNNNASNLTLFIKEYDNLLPLTGFSIDTDSIQIIDLTQWFEEGNEPTSIEEFERLYPNLPTEYNAGSLLNLNADSIKSVGFNAYNGEYAKVLGGMQYYLNNVTSLAFKENLEDEEEVIEIPSDNLYTPNTNGYLVATGSDICINLSHSGYRNGEYEVYKESIVNLPIEKYFPDGMKSAGDARDEIVWDESIGKYKAIQRVGSVDMGTLVWGVGFGGFYNVLQGCKYRTSMSERPCLTTARYPTSSSYNIDMIISTFLKEASYSAGLIIKDSSYTNVKSFIQSLQGQILYYELETPIETIIEDFDKISYEMSDFGTEEIISDEPTTPIVIDVIYGVNAVDTLNRLPQNYISIDSIQDFLAQLSLAMGGNWTIEYDEINRKYSFTFTANEVVDNEE